MSCESLAADWKIFLRRTKNHSAEIEKIVRLRMICHLP